MSSSKRIETGPRSFANYNPFEDSSAYVTIYDRFMLRKLHVEMETRRREENKEVITVYPTEPALVIQLSMSRHWLFQELTQDFYPRYAEGEESVYL